MSETKQINSFMNELSKGPKAGMLNTPKPSDKVAVAKKTKTNIVKATEEVANKTEFTDLRLHAIFKEATPHKSWNWNGKWLLNYYKEKQGIIFASQWEAIQYKIEEVHDRCKILSVYDNSKATQMVFKLGKDSKIYINNLPKTDHKLSTLVNNYKIGSIWTLLLDISKVKRVV